MIRILLFSIMLFIYLYGSADTFHSVKEVIKKDNCLFLKEDGNLFSIDTKVVIAKPVSSKKEIPLEYKIIREEAFGYVVIEVPQKEDIQDYVRKLKETKLFKSVDYITEVKCYWTPNDSLLNDQWFVNKLKLPYVWEITKGNPNIKVAIIDTGVDRDHFDIGYGYGNYTNISYTYGWDYVSDSQYHTPHSEGSHGTEIAGLIGAKTNNTHGVAGMAGGNNSSGVTLIPYRVIERGGDTTSSLGTAIKKAVDQGANIINISMGQASTPSVIEALDYAHDHGVIVICATGNEGNPYISFPASYNTTIAVGASNFNDLHASYSNYGTGIDLVAPTYLSLTTSLNNGYSYMTATSMAAALVSGTAALMLSVNSSLTHEQIRLILHKTAIKLSDYTYDSNGWNSEVGYGMLNTYAAVCTAKVSLTGPSIVCNSGSFSISEIPTGASVSWSVSNNCLSIVSGQGTGSVTLQEVNSGICDVSVHFSVGGQVLCTLTKKDVVVGTPDLGMSIQFKTSSGVNGCWASNMIGNTFTIESDLSWAYDRVEAQLYRMDNNFNPSTLVNSWSNISTTNASIPGYTAGWYLFKLRGVNDCGYSDWLEQEVEMVDFSMLNFLLDYDAASETLTLTLIEPDAENSTQQVLRGTYDVELWNGLTTTKVRSYRTDLTKYQMSLAGLPRGIYIVRVVIDGKTYSKKFVKR